jgi:BirA family biotin operon repressor/biotin-[acetyl-CoA-carboxylase] ligase
MAETNLSAELISRDLPTQFIGQKVVYYASLDSTMDSARQEARWGAPAGTAVVAEEQTAGRGRLQRSWVSPPGTLALSIVLRPNLRYLPNMVMLASLAALYSIEKVTMLKASIKWPNDVRLGQKKVAGILIENELRRDQLLYCIIGIGINVNMRMAEYPQLSPIATSLSDELGRVVSRLDILQQLFVEMERLYLTLQEYDLVFEDWKNHLEMMGQKIQVMMGGRIYRGKAESVTREGALLLRQADGSLRPILAGDVSLLAYIP